MKEPESLTDFYNNHPGLIRPPIGKGNKDIGHFNVYPRGGICHSLNNYQRRDFYKIALSIGGGELYYSDKAIQINAPALFFSNPNIAYSWEPSQEDQTGYFCLFTEDFINSAGHAENPINTSLFKIGGDPIYFLDKEQLQDVNGIFLKMIKEISSDYIHKYDVLRNYVYLLVHEAIKLKPADTYFKPANASARIASLFIDLLERQFPIDSPDYALKLKTATDYANNLSLHVNHLNRAVKEVTGKTTTTHISERVVTEAKALLQHTNWNIAEVAYGLGFEYPAYFNNFFKKQTGTNPSGYRLSIG